MPDPIRSEDRLHDEAEALLPWYATGELDQADRALVEKHLPTCGQCQRQLAFEHRMVDEFQAFSPETDAGWARLRRRLEPREAWRQRLVREGAHAWRQFSRPPVAALAFAQVAFVVVAGGLLLSLSQPSYRALGSAPVPAAANVIVMFRPDTTEAEIRRALGDSSASLVGGPTAADAYLLSVPAEARVSALARLRADGEITLAEPIDGQRP